MNVCEYLTVLTYFWNKFLTNLVNYMSKILIMKKKPFDCEALLLQFCTQTDGINANAAINARLAIVFCKLVGKW